MKRHYFAQISIVLLSLFVMVSCKQSNTEGTEETVEFKRTSNTVAVRTLNDADLLNPLMTTINTSRMVADQVFQYLLYVDPKTLELIPELATSRPAATDIEEGPYKGGVKYTFEIQEAAVWDDGSPITAEDYLFTMKALMIPGVGNAAFRSFASSLKDIQIDPENNKKFDVFFDKKHFQAEEIAGNMMQVMPRHIYDAEGLLDEITYKEVADQENASALAESNAQVAQFIESINDPKFTREMIKGSGPYQFEEWVPGQRIVLNKKDNWWGDALADDYPALQAYPDQIIFQPIPEDLTAVTALKSEEIDIVIGIPASDFLDLQKQEDVSSVYNFYTPEQMAFYFLYLNTDAPKLSDKRVRKALAHSINVDTIINQVYKGFGKRTASPVWQDSPDYNDDLQPVEFNPGKAKSLLSEAGWEDSNNNGIVDKEINGTLTELSLEYGLGANRPTSEAVALLIKDYAQAVGIDIQLNPLEMTQWIPRLNNRDYEIYSGGLLQTPIWGPRQHWHSEGANRMAFASAYTDELIEKSEVASAEERREIYKELQKIIYEEQPSILLMVPQNRMAIHKRFETPITDYYPGYFPNLVRHKEEELIGNR